MSEVPAADNPEIIRTMGKETVYLETSVISYLTARPSNDLMAAAWQKATLDWWDTQRDRFELYISDVVLDEAGTGDSIAAARRLDVLAGIPVLALTNHAVSLSRALIAAGAVPARALGDALHIAVSAVHGVDYLLTWNCRHIDNAKAKPIIRKICAANGYAYPEICTPQELMGAVEDG